MAMFSLLFIELSPSLKTLGLIKWRDEHGGLHTFRLGDRVCSKWRHFGILLDLDQSKLDGFDSQYRGNLNSSWNAVMSHWLAGGGGRDYPATWKGLYALLSDMELPRVASDLEKAVAGYCLL